MDTFMNKNITGKIMIVDDNPDNLHLIGKILKNKGHKVHLATDGTSAIKTISLINPDMILLDIMMPGIDGYEVCSKLKSDENTKNIPIIFLSSLHSSKDKIKAFRSGGIDYIEKPFEEEEILTRIQTHLALVDLYRSLENKIQKEVEKNRSQQALMMQQSRLAQMGEMISMIAHQWRQPLNNISYMIQSVILNYEKNSLNDKKMNSFEIDVKEQLLFMSNTIDDFKNFFKPEKQKESFDLYELIKKTVDLIKPVIKKEKIDITINAYENIMVNSFKNELGQVIFNILNNSKDALSQKNIPHKYINISIEHNNNDAMIQIDDNGGGIDKSIIDKIYDPYFSTKSDKNGTGLGLYMSKIIIEDHMKGKLNIENFQDGLSVSIILSLKEG